MRAPLRMAILCLILRPPPPPTRRGTEPTLITHATGHTSLIQFLFLFQMRAPLRVDTLCLTTPPPPRRGAGSVLMTRAKSHTVPHFVFHSMYFFSPQMRAPLGVVTLCHILLPPPPSPLERGAAESAHMTRALGSWKENTKCHYDNAKCLMGSTV